MKARNLIHARIEENIRAKISRLRAEEPQEDSCKDALQLLIEHSWKRGERLDMQVTSSFRRCQGWGGGSPDFQDISRWEGGPKALSGHPTQTVLMNPEG